MDFQRDEQREDGRHAGRPGASAGDSHGRTGHRRAFHSRLRARPRGVHCRWRPHRDPPPDSLPLGTDDSARAIAAEVASGPRMRQRLRRLQSRHRTALHEGTRSRLRSAGDCGGDATLLAPQPELRRRKPHRLGRQHRNSVLRRRHLLRRDRTCSTPGALPRGSGATPPTGGQPSSLDALRRRAQYPATGLGAPSDRVFCGQPLRLPAPLLRCRAALRRGRVSGARGIRATPRSGHRRTFSASIP